jgi:hypothetical protein
MIPVYHTIIYSNSHGFVDGSITYGDFQWHGLCSLVLAARGGHKNT